MRLLLMFDLPTTSAKDRKTYRKFRKFLLDEGFIMHQYSVYSKIVLNNSVKNLLVKRITEQTPKKGMVTLLSVTEKQFSKMIYLTGEEDRNLAATDKRLIILGDDDD